jgi:hypothetical protein
MSGSCRNPIVRLAKWEILVQMSISLFSKSYGKSLQKIFRTWFSSSLWVDYYRDATVSAIERGVGVLDLIMDRPEQTLAVVSHGAFSSEAVFGSKHARIKSSCAPPRLNYEVRGVRVTRGADGVFILVSLEEAKL